MPDDPIDLGARRNAGRVVEPLDKAAHAFDPEPPARAGIAAKLSVSGAFRTLLIAADENPDREGLRDTPARAMRAWYELTAGYREDPAALLRDFDSDGYDEMVVVRALPVYSLCEHHLLPFHGEAHIAYIPDKRIVGLSKLARLVDVFARRLQVQERLTRQIADTLQQHLVPRGVAVVVSAEHMCMSMRGVRAAGHRTVTSALTGAIAEKPAARAEALALLNP